MLPLRSSAQRLAKWLPNSRNITRSLGGEGRQYLSYQHSSTSHSQSATQYFCFSSASSVPGGTDNKIHAEQSEENNSTSKTTADSAAVKPRTKKATKRLFIPPKAAVKFTPKSRQYLKLLIQNSPKADQTKGILLNYQQASDGTPHMVFTFKFLASDDDVNPMDEA